MPGARSQRRVNNVASDATTFVGRSRELREIRDFLNRTRLLTLVGPGGVGKTRLTKAAVAGHYRSFADGARFVDLSQAFEDDAVVQLIRDATPGVRDASTLVAQLSDRHLLLVLDNCEHLVEQVGSIASQLLSWCPAVKIIATTRLPLGITGEQVMHVTPLGVQESGSGRASDSAILFIDRARAITGRDIAESELNAVNELCVRLEGLPLAIELAAIKSRVMTVREISAGLEDRFDLLVDGPRDAPVRHRSLDAMLRWSWDHCSADERSLWSQMSVFAGSVPMNAIAAVCALPGSTSATRIVDGLVQQSLLAVDHTPHGIRFRMLDTIREFGRKTLNSGSQDPDQLGSVRVRHLQYYADFVSARSTAWFGRGQHDSSQLTVANIADIRVAFEYALEDSECFAIADALFSGLWLFWVSARLAEGRVWAEKLYRESERLGRAPSSATLWTCGWISLLSGAIPEARGLLLQAADRAAIEADSRSDYLSKGLLAACAAIESDLASAAERYDEVVAAAQAGGDPMSLAVVLQNRAEVSCFRGDYVSAVADCELAETICTQNGDEWLLLYVLWVRTLIGYCQGNFASAQRDATRALRLRTATDNEHGVALVAETLAWLLTRRGQSGLAAVLLGATARYWAATGGTLMGVASLIDNRARCLAELTELLGSEELERLLMQGSSQDVTALQELTALIEAGAPTEQIGAPQQPIVAGTAGRPAMAALKLAELTDRQYEIALLVAQGLTNKDIATALVIGRRTVDTHVGNILARLGLCRRSEVAALIGSGHWPDVPAPRRIGPRHLS